MNIQCSQVVCCGIGECLCHRLSANWCWISYIWNTVELIGLVISGGQEWMAKLSKRQEHHARAYTVFHNWPHCTHGNILRNHGIVSTWILQASRGHSCCWLLLTRTVSGLRLWSWSLLQLKRQLKSWFELPVFIFFFWTTAPIYLSRHGHVPSGKTSSPFYPATNRLAKRTMKRALNASLRQGTIHQSLYSFFLCYCSTPHATTTV